jgi:hypothetical protein
MNKILLSLCMITVLYTLEAEECTPYLVEHTESDVFINEYDATLNRIVSSNSSKHPAPVADSVFVTSFPAPGSIPRGCTFDGTDLWIADHSGTLYKVNALTGAVIGSWPAPAGTGACGLAWDGAYLWHSDCLTDVIYKIDPNTMAPVSQFTAPGTAMMFDLAWDGTNLYGALGNDDYILGFTTTGVVIDSIHATYTAGNVRPFGLTYLSTGAGELWASDGTNGANTVNLWDFGTSTWFKQWSATPANYLCGLAYDSVSGYMWITCCNSDQVYVWDVGPQTSIQEEPSNTESLLFGFATTISTVSRGHLQIAYTLSTPSHVSLNVYDSMGRLVQTLVNSHQTTAEKNVYWDCTNLNGHVIADGIYFLKLKAGDNSQTKKILLMK